MKRRNTMSVHRSGARKAQVKSFSKRLLTQSFQSHLVEFSHEYFTKSSIKFEGHSFERSPGPVRQSVPLPAHPVTFSPNLSSTDTHAIFSEQSRSTTIQTRSSHEFLAVLIASLLTPLVHPYRYRVHTCMCGFVAC